jgi:hypothetical protein
MCKCEDVCALDHQLDRVAGDQGGEICAYSKRLLGGGGVWAALVVDPVLVATSGDELAGPAVLDVLRYRWSPDALTFALFASKDQL